MDEGDAFLHHESRAQSEQDQYQHDVYYVSVNRPCFNRVESCNKDRVSHNQSEDK